MYLKFRNRLKFYVPYFFSPFRTKHTYKKTNMHSYKTNLQHTAPNLGPQVGLLKEKKTIRENIIYLPTLLFVVLLAIFKIVFPLTSLSSFNNKSD